MVESNRLLIYRTVYTVPRVRIPVSPKKNYYIFRLLNIIENNYLKIVIINYYIYILKILNIIQMYKLKTRKAALKRYKKTSSGKFLRRHAYKGHLLRKKSKTQKRRLSQTVVTNLNDSSAIKLMLPY